MSIENTGSSSDYLKLNTCWNHNEPYTWMAWIRLTADLDSFSVPFCTASSSTEYEGDMLRTTGTGTALRLYSNVAGTFSNSAAGVELVAGTWVHVAIVRSSPTLLTLFVNGVETSTLTTDVSSRAASTAAFMTILSQTDTAPRTNVFAGRVAFVKVWTSVLTEAQIATEMDYVAPQVTANIWEWWTLSAGDYSGQYLARDWVVAGSIADADDPPGVTWPAAPEPDTAALRVWWRAYGTADATTDYIIQSDKSVSGTFETLATQDATDRGDGFYYPFTSTLGTDIDADETELTMTGTVGVTAGARVKIDAETVLLGDRVSNTFTGCTRGADGTLPAAHLADTTVYQMHESYGETLDPFGSRNAIRYRVIAVVNGVQDLPAECVVVKPTLPPTTNFCRVWGILESTQGAAMAGQTVTLQRQTGREYNPGTAETYARTLVTVTTDADGYWELLVPRNIARSGGDVFRLTVDGKFHPLAASIPNVDTICYLELI